MVSDSKALPASGLLLVKKTILIRVKL